MASDAVSIVIAHHKQALHMAIKTCKCRHGFTEFVYPSNLDELRKVGRKFTTRVERRLRKKGIL